MNKRFLMCKSSGGSVISKAVEQKGFECRPVLTSHTTWTEVGAESIQFEKLDCHKPLALFLINHPNQLFKLLLIHFLSPRQRRSICFLALVLYTKPIPTRAAHMSLQMWTCAAGMKTWRLSVYGGAKWCDKTRTSQTRWGDDKSGEFLPDGDTGDR